VHIFEARAWDKAGNLGTSPSLRVVVSNDAPPAEDRTPPDLWWLAPEAGSTLTDTVTIQISFFDESGVDSIVLLKDGGLAVSLPPAPRGGTEGGVEYLWDTRQDSDGVHLWEARAWDASGNTGVSAGLLVRVQNHETPAEDHTPPVIVWRSPTPGDTLQGRIELRFDVMDDVGVDSVRLIVNGRSPAAFILLAQQEVSYSFEWNSNNFEDGAYLIEIRAWDASGNIGFGSPISFWIWNNRPRVIWVPDDYDKIQDAINASEDGDTVRVRAGMYREGIYFWDKDIWLESESGPERTIIEATGWSFGIRIDWGQDTTTVIRGFTVRNAEADDIIVFQGSPNIYNNIITASGRGSINIIGVSRCVIRNNVFEVSASSNVSIYTCYGVFENNLVIHSPDDAMWNRSVEDNPLIPDYNLFWDYGELRNEPNPFIFGPNNIYDEDPMLIENTYIPSQNSPCIDAGNPWLSDLDGSRSDIGAYGGPYAYPVN
jgi:hypothetical protein